MKFRLSLIAVSLTLFLVGCSAHPGAGNWLTSAENSLGVAKVMVHFEGRAELLDADGNELVRCFWAAKDKTVLMMDCTTEANPDNKVRYALNAGPKKATLSTAGHEPVALDRGAE